MLLVNDLCKKYKAVKYTLDKPSEIFNTLCAISTEGLKLETSKYLWPDHFQHLRVFLNYYFIFNFFNNKTNIHNSHKAPSTITENHKSIAKKGIRLSLLPRGSKQKQTEEEQKKIKNKNKINKLNK